MAQNLCGKRTLHGPSSLLANSVCIRRAKDQACTEYSESVASSRISRPSCNSTQAVLTKVFSVRSNWTQLLSMGCNATLCGYQEPQGSAITLQGLVEKSKRLTEAFP